MRTLVRPSFRDARCIQKVMHVLAIRIIDPEEKARFGTHPSWIGSRWKKESLFSRKMPRQERKHNSMSFLTSSGGDTSMHRPLLGGLESGKFECVSCSTARHALAAELVLFDQSGLMTRTGRNAKLGFKSFWEKSLGNEGVVWPNDFLASCIEAFWPIGELTTSWQQQLQLHALWICQFESGMSMCVAYTSGSRATLTPKIFPKSCRFQAILWGKSLFWANVQLRPPWRQNWAKSWICPTLFARGARHF